MDAKLCEKYASTLGAEETIKALSLVSERGLKWLGAPGEAVLEPKKRLVIEAALIQNIEDLSRVQFLDLLSCLEKARAYFGACSKHLRTGIVFSLNKHIPDFDHNEFFSLVGLLGDLRFGESNMIPILKILFAQKLDSGISNMGPEGLSTMLTGLSNMGFQWKSLKVVYGDQRVDLRDAIVEQASRQFVDFEFEEVWAILIALDKIGYVKGHTPEEMEGFCIRLLKNCIRECVGDQTKQIWLLYKKMKFGKQDIGTELHRFLQEAVYGPSKPPKIDKPRHSKRPKLKQPMQHESPDPYHDYRPY